MDQCSCGARLAPEASWCSQCYEPVASAPKATPVSVPEPRTGRWDASPTTFGLTGRVVGTVLTSLPLLALLALFVTFRLIAIVILMAVYLVFIVRPVMRSLWRRSDL